MKKFDKSLNLSDKSDASILNSLKNLGFLAKDFKDVETLKELSIHTNKEIRYYSINNLGKLSNQNLLKTFVNLLKSEKTSKNRREITSSIGRLRSPKAIKTLVKLLQDSDPNVILQAIRGLLVFKDDKDIKEKLLKLKDHENELVKTIIEVEFNNKKIYSIDHHKSPDDLKNKIINGDTLKVLKKIQNESIHLTFTSPPYYNARDYSIYNSYKSYIKFLVKIFKEVHRVTKEGRFFILNTSPIIIPRIGRKYSSKRYPIPYDLHYEITKMGWEFIDDIVWVKPEPSAKNRIAGFDSHRKPLAYKPNCITECVMVYRKKSNKLIDWIYDQYPKSIVDESKINEKYETSNTWYIDPSHSKVHSAVFPLDLCDRVIKFYSFKGDLIFDPFAGSGSVGISAKRNNRYYLLSELNKSYYEEIKKKLETDTQLSFYK